MSAKKNPEIKISERERQLLLIGTPTKSQKEDFTEEIRKYDSEYRLFEVLNKKIRKQGHLTNEDLFEICMWKSPRQKKRYQENNPDEVIKTTEKAFKENTDLGKLISLLDLNGIGIPTASAILAVYDPENFGVIDIRALQVLNSAGLIDSDNANSEKIWSEYIKKLRLLKGKYACTARAVDKALYTMHLQYTKNRNLYKKK